MVVFHVALTLGLEHDLIDALEQTVGMIEATARRNGSDCLVQASFGVSDGTSLWAVRYATEGRARSLFASASVDAIRRLHPDNPRFARLSPDDRVIVSEPFSDLPGLWEEIPQGTAVTVRRGGVLEQRPFRPRVVAARDLVGAPSGPAGVERRCEVDDPCRGGFDVEPGRDHVRTAATKGLNRPT